MDRHDAGAGVVVADGAVRVHRHARRAGPVELGSDGAVGVLECPVDLPEGERALVGGVGSERLVDERGALVPRGNRVEHDRELLVGHLDQLAGVLGDVPVLRDHRGHRFAVVANLLDRDHVLHDRAGAEGRQRRGVLRDVLARHHPHDAGERLGLRGVDGDDPRVGVRAPDDRRMEHPGQLDVVEVAALAPQEARVLDAVQALAEPAPWLVGARRLACDLGCVRILLGDAHASPPPAAARIDSTMCW